ncbi:protein trichome birefringence-like 6 [Sesamum alatum]|uniref:Protein trichome birefringence-like 6 n=1 Tax=Sesamum alatum TaxID=300844 RepID=A0AAE1XUX1_9LAMI|nr:protein trichome birefringence-like 6 [Sesamum alatum]
MEKQRSFSIKPVRFLVFSFTLSFSIIFLVFFSTWVVKTTPSLHLPTHNLGFNTTSLTVPSVTELNTTSSQYLLKSSILLRSHIERDENSSRIADVSSLEGAQKGESEITVVKDAESSDSLLTGNSSIHGVSSSYSTNSTVVDTGELGHVGSNSTDEEFQELNDVIDSTSGKQDIMSDSSFERQHIALRNNVEEKNKLDCDITKGRWVIDESYPLYTNASCPFIDEGFNCEGNGRLDKDYMKWRWQPHDCDIPRFDPTKMLELIRGKRLVFVGDSINRNQWESMLCLLMGAVKDPKKVYETRGRKITKEKGNYCFKFEDYKCTVEYYLSHFLVHESKARIGKKRGQTLRIDTVDKGSSRWRGADILVFNTAHWWNHHKTKAGINYYQEGDRVHPQLDVTEGFRRALLTWASWVDKYINPRKTLVFFRSSAPSHFSGGQWNTGGHCREAFQPINESFTSNYPARNLIVDEIIQQMKNPVTLLNITRLSDYRADAHPSIYGRKSVNPGVEDCSHWCLPGVPDTWNELLYYYLQLRTLKGSFVD